MKWEAELQIASDAAKIAGGILKSFDRSRVVDSSGRDIKHQADRESENAILDYLDRKSDFPVLAEESGEHEGHRQGGFQWIIDPLDGTLNFTYGVPFCCVSIGLWEDESPVLGVVYDFIREEIFAGVVGQGAWLNGEPVSCHDAVPENKAVLATGFPVNRNFEKEPLLKFLDHIQGFKKVRLFGSAALSLAYVACGRVHAYMEEDIMFWDVAAGIALVQAAGGDVEIGHSEQKKWARIVFAGNVLKNNF